MKNDTNILLHAIPGFIILFVIESVLMLREHRLTPYKKDIPISVCLGLGFLIISAFSKSFIILVYSFVYKNRIISLNNDIWWIWIICFFADDFTYYWFHRLSHVIRF